MDSYKGIKMKIVKDNKQIKKPYSENTQCIFPTTINSLYQNETVIQETNRT